jgi:hypothetical protein
MLYGAMVHDMASQNEQSLCPVLPIYCHVTASSTDKVVLYTLDSEFHLLSLHCLRAAGICVNVC